MTQILLITGYILSALGVILSPYLAALLTEQIVPEYKPTLLQSAKKYYWPERNPLDYQKDPGMILLTLSLVLAILFFVCAYVIGGVLQGRMGG